MTCRTVKHRRVIVDPRLSGRPRPAGSAAARRPQRPVRGAGDWVELWAKPIARVIDRSTALLGGRWATQLDGCSACSRRRRVLNAIVPDVRSLAAWRGAAGRVWRQLRAA